MLVVEAWRTKCTDCGIEIVYNIDGHLIGSRSRRSDTAKWSELKFADDTAIIGASREKIELAMSKLFAMTKRWGMIISVPKTKAMVVGKVNNNNDSNHLTVEEHNLEFVNSFKYLGSIVSNNGSIEEDVKERIAKASRAFGCLKKSVFQNKLLSIKTKRAVYRAVVLGTDLLYGAEPWTTKRYALQKLESLHNRCLRGVFSITKVQQRVEHITSSQI